MMGNDIYEPYKQEIFPIKQLGVNYSHYSVDPIEKEYVLHRLRYNFVFGEEKELETENVESCYMIPQTAKDYILTGLLSWFPWLKRFDFLKPKQRAVPYVKEVHKKIINVVPAYVLDADDKHELCVNFLNGCDHFRGDVSIIKPSPMR